MPGKRCPQSLLFKESFGFAACPFAQHWQLPSCPVSCPHHLSSALGWALPGGDAGSSAISMEKLLWSPETMWGE